MPKQSDAGARSRVRIGGAALCMGVLLGACSGGSSAGPGERLGPDKTPVACGLLGPLDAAAAKVKAADPANAVAFTATLVDAKAQYLAGLAKLGEQLPDAMQSTVDAVKVSVETDDFVSAAKARAPLDDWVAENC